MAELVSLISTATIHKIRRETKMSRKAIILTGILALLLAGPWTGFAGAKDVIKIGMTISTTGKYTFASSQGFKGVTIWAEQINAGGGLKLDGKQVPVELIYYDDRSDKETVVKLYEKLINEDKVNVRRTPKSIFDAQLKAWDVVTKKLVAEDPCSRRSWKARWPGPSAAWARARSPSPATVW